ERAAQLWFRFRFGEQADAYFEVPLSDRFGEAFNLTAHTPAPEPEPEWAPGTVADITVDFDTHRAIRAEIGVWRTVGNKSFTDSRVDEVAPLVVIDPADVDRVALQREIDDAMPGHEASVALERLGLNR